MSWLLFAAFALTLMVAPQFSLAEDHPTNFSVPVTIVTTAEDVKDRARSEAHDVADLEAQQRAAKASETAAQSALRQESIARDQMVLSLIGTIFLCVTVYLTGRATKAATKANEVAVTLAAADRRPWLKLGRPTVKIRHVEGVKLLTLSLEVSNLGKTPARFAELHADIRYSLSADGSVKEVEAFASGLKVGKWKNGMKVIFPDSSRPFSTDVSLEAVPEGKVFCRILYGVTYVADGLEQTCHSAGEVVFPARLLKASPRSAGGANEVSKYDFYGIGSVT